jgi:hypothetical protein
MSMTERRVALDTALTQGMPDLAHSDTGNTRRDSTDSDRKTFEQALARNDGSTDQVKAPSADLPQVAGPFALFGGPAASEQRDTKSTPNGLTEGLAQAADRLLVGDGSSGRREVRIDLKDEVLPGVTVSVYEDEGRLVAAFACSSESSRETLNGCAQPLADELARSLSRPTLVRVTTDDPEDPCLYEAAAAA